MSARVYLSRAEFAQRIGVSPSTMSRYRLPDPDAMIGDVRGWLPATVDAWNAARPGRGARTDLAERPRYATRADAEADGWRVAAPRYGDRDVTRGRHVGYRWEAEDGRRSVDVRLTEDGNALSPRGVTVSMIRRIDTDRDRTVPVTRTPAEREEMRTLSEQARDYQAEHGGSRRAAKRAVAVDEEPQ